MRTLKKSLALVLALVMVLGLGVVGASADNKLDDYTDAKDIGDAYVEAVGVMTGLEIVDGMTETTIDPTATYTREQAAKIIAYMVLGKTAADSLTCTVAPFDDVAADRWSAGYISFCVEQGIIDGMTDTTFEPTGTLTGFQWAKMLLSAVGFNAKGEFTGDSWSLNTARVAHSVGLFTGDAAGADHVALQRQQAMLYAFNTLTSVGCVVYSEALGDYMYSYSDYIGDRYSYEGTLGWNVFKLKSVEGIVTGAEGTGESTTEISEDYDGGLRASVDADLDAYMLYHGVRVWYVADKKSVFCTTGDAVYVNDLSKVTTLNCPSKSARDNLFKGVSNLETGLKVGSSNYDPYEVALVDNSAVDLPSDTNNNAQVYYYMDLGELGTRSTAKDTVVVDGTAVKNDNVWTDISDIDRGAGIVYMVANTTGNSTKAVYYVYPTSTTVGGVEKVTSSGVITLTDGTEIAPSVFVDDLAGKVAYLRAEVASPISSTPRYAFTLDSHGHWIDYGQNSLKAVAYWTGDVRPTSDHDAWTHDVTFDALFARVSNGEIVAVPVTNNWIKTNLSHIGEGGGYYDITDNLVGDTTYSPIPLKTSEKYGSYDFKNSFTVKADKFEITCNGIDYIFNPDTVQYYIAEDYGNGLTVTPYTGNDELIEGLNTEGGAPIDTVTLQNVAVLTKEVDNSKVVTVIFGYNGVKSVSGGILFLPHGLTSADWTYSKDNYIAFTGKGDVYLNGFDLNDEDSNIIYIKVGDFAKFSYDAGFYRYTMDAQGYITELTEVNTQFKTITGVPGTTGDGFYVLGDHEVSTDVVVRDVRTGVQKAEYDGINEMAAFFNENADPTHPLNLVYRVVDSKVVMIYVVDAIPGEDTYKVTVNNETNGQLTFTADPIVLKSYNEETVTIELKTEATWSATDGTLNIEVNNKPVALDWADDITVSADKKTASFELTVRGNTAVDIISFVPAE